jgi:nucleolar GTP-binding protein
MYKDIPIISVDEIINKAFSRSSRTVAKGRGIKAISRKEMEKVERSASIIMSSLDKVVNRYPKIPAMDDFNREMFDILIGLDNLRRHLKVLNKTIGSVYRAQSIALKKMDGLRDPDKIIIIRKDVYGKYNSLLQSARPSIQWLNDARQKIIEIPPVSSDNYNVVIAGYPNVGKSSLLKRLTTSKPVIASYPFTTTGINMGTFELKYQRIFVIDTPGLLDRPIADRNEVEQKAFSAIRYLADTIIFVFDASEHRQYTLEAQRSLLSSIRETMGDKRFIIANNKIDVPSERIEADVYLSTMEGTGVPELQELLYKTIQSDPVFKEKRALRTEAEKSDEWSPLSSR